MVTLPNILHKQISWKWQESTPCSKDLEQGGLKLPAKFRFTVGNKNIYKKLKTGVHNLIQKCREEKLKSTRVISSYPKAKRNRKKTIA